MMRIHAAVLDKVANEPEPQAGENAKPSKKMNIPVRLKEAGLESLLDFLVELGGFFGVILLTKTSVARVNPCGARWRFKNGERRGDPKRTVGGWVIPSGGRSAGGRIKGFLRPRGNPRRARVFRSRPGRFTPTPRTTVLARASQNRSKTGAHQCAPVLLFAFIFRTRHG
jgi:hypothetical protein